MATKHTLTITELATLAGVPYAKNIRAYVVTNLPKGEALIDTTTNEIMAGGLAITLLNGSGSVSLPATDATDLNVVANTVQYEVRAEYVDPATRGRETWRSGYFALTGPADLADLATDASPMAVESASAYAQEAKDARDEAVTITGISSTDSAVAALVNTVSGPLTQAAIGAKITTATDSVRAAAIPRTLTPEQQVSVDVNEAAAIVGETQVAITTPYGGINAIVHPNLLFFAEGWNGWRYWMAYTPYNGGDPQLENPCIAVSNDGESWSVPAGLTNPIEASPAGAGYNADPVLFMTADGRTMCMVFKVNDATKQLVLRTTTDGVTWTAKQVILDNTYEDVSPAILWDRGKYRMWTIVYDDAVVGSSTANKMYQRTADDPAGPWSAPTACTETGLPEGALAGGALIWHIDIKRVGQEYHCVMATAPDAGQPTGVAARLWFGKSTDGLAWTYARQSVINTGGFTQQGYYKAAILPKVTPQGIAYDMWYSGTGDYKMYKTEIRFDRTALRERINNGIIAARSALSPWLVADDFNRADTTAGLGTSLTGQAWSTATGNNMGIQSNQAYLPTAANSRAIIESGSGDHRVGMTYPVRGTSGWIIFRYVDGSNLWRVGHSSSGVIQLQKIVGGSVTALTGSGLFNLLRDGDRLEVEAVGSSIRLFLNGREFYKVTDSALTTGTKVGINVDNITARFDNFTARSI